MAKALIVIAQIGFQDHEYSDTKEVLEDNGVEVTTASVTSNQASGKYGLMVMPNIAAKDVKIDDYDVFIMIGGPGAINLGDSEDVLNLFRQARLNHKKIGAICVAPAVLAKAGVLEGRRATVWKSIDTMRAFQNAKIIMLDRPVVRDRDLVTGNGPEAAIEFGKAIVEMLNDS